VGPELLESGADPSGHGATTECPLDFSEEYLSLEADDLDTEDERGARWP